MYRVYPPLIISHRGESSEAPENTLSAINLAWESGADGVEIDVHLTKDNQIVVIHNSRTKLISGKRFRIKSSTLENLKSLDIGRTIGKKYYSERIPTLNEVLLTVPPGKYIFIEIKCGVEIIPHLSQVLKHTNLSLDQIKIIGFGFNKMTEIKKNFPEYEVFLNRRISLGKVFSRRSYWHNLIIKLKQSSLNGLNLSYTKTINFKLVEMFRQNKLKIFIWTVNNPKKALRLISLGVDGFMSDRSGWIRKMTALQ
jgi:glycerophosphoryl diester phosphodiesterase